MMMSNFIVYIGNFCFKGANIARSLSKGESYIARIRWDCRKSVCNGPTGWKKVRSNRKVSQIFIWFVTEKFYVWISVLVFSHTRAICDYGQCVTWLSVSCLRIIFIAISHQVVINNSFDVSWDVRYYVVLTLLPCLVLGEVRNLKYLMPFSAVSFLCIVITFAITLWYMISGPLKMSQRPMFIGWGQFPLFFR